jgi:anti-sigma factor RsiW
MTDPASCAAFEADLSALLDGELERARESEVRAHLAGCARCTERLARLARVDEALRSLPPAEVPAGLGERLRARIGAEERVGASDRRGSRERGPAPTRRRRWIPLAATALAAAASLALYLLVARPRPAQEEPPVAVVERPAPEREIARREPPAQPGTEVPEADLEAIAAASDDELALALDLDTLADFEVIERLELLEALSALDGAG